MAEGVTLESIRAARESMRGQIIETPISTCPHLSAICGCRIHLKLENHQRCRSFKFRGALNKISRLPPGTIATCASAGNHSQGTAHASALCGMQSIIYMPLTAPLAKVDATRGYGAEVVQCGLGLDDALAKCKEELALHPERTFIPPFDDPDVISGQGTIGLEIYEQHPEVDTIVIPVGGGGLAAGVATAVKALNPAIRIICVNASVRANFYKKYQTAKGREFHDIDTSFTGVPLADGIAVNTPGSLTFPIVEQLADEFVLVTEDEIAEAIALLAERAKLVCEGSGAAAFAAVMAKKFEFKREENIVCIVSGGNIELSMLSRCIDRALFLWGRRRQLTACLPLGTDAYIAMLKLMKAYGLELLESEAMPHVHSRPNYAEHTMTVEIANPALIDELCAKCRENGWDVRFISCE
jgi:threonine dehydratase